MIPLKVTLRNFLSYGSKAQVIDLDPYHLICFSGKNGHGKSALLDAITWAIWGHARKISSQAKPDINLLRLGQSTMMVIVDITCNNHMYRIKREFALTKTQNHYANLEFALIDDQHNIIKSLTEKSIRSTQEHIIKTIGISYETFVNTAFLRQGNANEFSKQSPKERKEILAQILQLDKFDELKKKAAEKTKHFQQQVSHLQHRHDHLVQELDQFEQKQKAHQLITHELDRLQQEEQITLQDIDTIKRAINALQQKKWTVEHDIAHIQKHLTEKKEKQQKITTLFSAWRLRHKQQLKKEFDTIKLKKNNLLLLANTFQQAQEKHTHLKEQLYTTTLRLNYEQHTFLQKKLELETQEKIKKEKMYGEKSKLKALIDQTKDQENSLRNELALVDKACAEIQTQLNSYDQQIPQVERQKKQYEKRRLYYQKWFHELKLLAHEKDQTKSSLHAIEQNYSCPTCQQAMSEQRKEKITYTYLCKLRTCTQKYKRLQTILPKLKAIIIDQKTSIDNCIEIQQKYHILHNELAHKKSLKKKLIDNGKTFAAHINNYELSLKKLYEKIQQTSEVTAQKKDTLNNLKQQVEQLQNEIKNCNYNSAEHQQVLQEWQRLESSKKNEQETDYHTEQTERKIQILELKKSLKQLSQYENNYKQQHINLTAITKQEKQSENRYRLLQDKKEHLQKVKESLLQEKAALKNSLTRLSEQQAELKMIEKEKNLMQQEVHDYTALTSIFSRDGLQALLIEEALPEIEQETNLLLAQLTNNQSHIIIESLRDLKKGGAKETLDIKISDSLGIRPYELFSGGEAFRIDFALRIAISKLLARRAGTSLQTLIIDEGFGSQDEEGLSLLMDAIYKIKNQFEKVIVVSHLSLLKEQFPVHFLIHKSGNGSSISVITH